MFIGNKYYKSTYRDIDPPSKNKFYYYLDFTHDGVRRSSSLDICF